MFNNPNRAKQLVVFDDITISDYSITDIDFCMEFGDKVWVIGDVKGKGVTLPVGQRILMERFVKMAREAGRKAIAIVCEHNVPNVREDIHLKHCQVREYYTTETGRWAFPRRPYYVEEMLRNYLGMNGGKCNGQIAGCGDVDYGY